MLSNHLPTDCCPHLYCSFVMHLFVHKIPFTNWSNDKHVVCYTHLALYALYGYLHLTTLLHARQHVYGKLATAAAAVLLVTETVFIITTSDPCQSYSNDNQYVQDAAGDQGACTLLCGGLHSPVLWALLCGCACRLPQLCLLPLPGHLCKPLPLPPSFPLPGPRPLLPFSLMHICSLCYVAFCPVKHLPFSLVLASCLSRPNAPSVVPCILTAC